MLEADFREKGTGLTMIFSFENMHPFMAHLSNFFGFLGPFLAPLHKFLRTCVPFYEETAEKMASPIASHDSKYHKYADAFVPNTPWKLEKDSKVPGFSCMLKVQTCGRMIFALFLNIL